MSLSRHIQQAVFSATRPSNLQELRCAVLEAGEAWYSQNAHEHDALLANMRTFELDTTPKAVAAIQHGILLHYYEKLIPFFCSAESYALYVSQHVDCADALGKITAAQNSGNACLLAISHFGAVELVAPALARNGLPVNAALRFTTQQLSDAAVQQAQRLRDTGSFSEVRFIEVGKPGVAAALDMAAVMRRGGILISVCDEQTEYSVPVSLLGRQVWGGAGLDRLLMFARAPHRLFAAFMIRTGGDSYRMQVDEIAQGTQSPIQALFDRLGDVASAYQHQWYFLHEEVPFVN